MFEKVRSIQLAWFPLGEPPSGAKLFDALIGGEPDGFQKISPPQVPFPMTVQFINRKNVQHRVHSHVGRIDYFIEGVPQGLSLELMTGPRDLLHEAIKTVGAVSELIGPVTRIAVIAVLASPVDNLSQVDEVFSEVFSGNYDLRDTYDLAFQLNKRAEIDGFEVNRLLRWNSEMIGMMQLVSASNAPSFVETPYANFTVDVNTVPSPERILSPREQASLFPKLVDAVESLIVTKRIEDFI